MKTALLILLLGMMGAAFGQDSALAPRASLLEGTADQPSAKGVYVVTFPPPNECVNLGEIRATSRTAALYRAVSKGGFSLKPATGGLTVWTIEEWSGFEKEAPEFIKEQKKHCALVGMRPEKPE